MSRRLAMPSGAEAARRAAATELRGSLAAIECAVRLLGSGPVSAEERPLVTAIRAELQHARRAARRVAAAANDPASSPSRSPP